MEAYRGGLTKKLEVWARECGGCAVKYRSALSTASQQSGGWAQPYGKQASGLGCTSYLHVYYKPVRINSQVNPW